MNIIVPKAGLTMTEATVENWMVSEGDTVEKGEVIADLMTEKMTVEVEAPEAGKIGSLIVQEGQEVKVGETIAILLTDGNVSVNKERVEKPKSGLDDNDVQVDKNAYDVAVIGSGPGGYVAAIRVAQLGGTVAIIEANELGGVCLNSGCMPTKTLLEGVEFIKAHNNAKEFGIYYEAPQIDYSQLLQKKENVVSQLQIGINQLLDKNKVTILRGTGTVISENEIEVKNNDQSKDVVTANNIIIATGSQASIPNIPGLLKADPLTNYEALERETLPESIAIVGGGAIGCEFAGIYSPLGVEVILIEQEDKILPEYDADISEYLHNKFEEDHIKILTSTQVREVNQVEKGKELVVFDGENTENIVVDEILVATGRQANIDSVSEVDVGEDSGNIQVDNQLRTSISSIFAIGDVTGKANLAHVASAQAIVAAENCMGEQSVINYDFIPKCIYTSPEIASVGLSEQEVINQNIDYSVGFYNFNSNGRALTSGNTEGFIKIIQEKKYNELLGVHIVGKGASELIAEGVLALNLEATTYEIISTIHAHPTRSEGMLEATLDSLGKSIHK